MNEGLFGFLIFTVAFWCLRGQTDVPKPVFPDWERRHENLFAHSLYPDIEWNEMLRIGTILEHNNSCLTGTLRPNKNTNVVWANLDKLPIFNGTTYWINDWLHVGHVHYDIVLMQALYKTKIDRIVMQRPMCHKANAVSLCSGIGSFEGWYAGYFNSILEAANVSSIPIYMRRMKDDPWLPVFLSSKDVKMSTSKGSSFVRPTNYTLNSSLPIKDLTCFERVLRRNYYLEKTKQNGAVPCCSSMAVQRFKRSAYQPFQIPYGLPLDDEITPIILFSFRSSPGAANRIISNQAEIISYLQQAFPSPTFDFRTLDSSVPDLTYETQLRAVSAAHVVITTHGAFEVNMIYMQGNSLLIELFGDMNHSPAHVFHRMALVFGLYYARVHIDDFKSMYQQKFNVTLTEIDRVASIVKNYTTAKLWRPPPFMSRNLSHHLL